MKSKLPFLAWGCITITGVFVVGYLDWITGYELNFFVFYYLPIVAGAWYLGFRASVSLSILSSLVWLWVDFHSGHRFPSSFYSAWETMIHLMSFVILGFTTSKIRKLVDAQRQLQIELQRSLSEIKKLESFLPICSVCKRVKESDGSWKELDDYIGEHTDSQFSHGFCPSCAKKILEDR